MNRYPRIASMSELAREQDEATAYDDLADQSFQAFTAHAWPLIADGQPASNTVLETAAFIEATNGAPLMTATERTGVKPEAIKFGRALPSVQKLLATLDTNLKLHTYLGNLQSELRDDPHDLGNAVLFAVLADEVKVRDDLARDEQARKAWQAQQQYQLAQQRRVRQFKPAGGSSDERNWK